MTDWSDRFGRSTLGSGIWYDRTYFAWLPGLSPGLRDQVFADGGTWSGDRGGAVPNWGRWVEGWGAMRFLCHIAGIRPPSRRLKGEPFLPDQAILVDVVLRLIAADQDGEDLSVPGPFDGREDVDATFWNLLHQAHREAGLEPVMAAPPPAPCSSKETS